MSDPHVSAAAVLEALGFALFRADTEGVLRICGEPPDWLSKLWPSVTHRDVDFPVAELSPFLENFLIDAAECWSKGAEERARSGPWVELDAAGGKYELEATALTINEEPLLLLERLGEVYAAKKGMLQIARENVIAQQRLNSEIEKKEILLHCVVEEMGGALANVITSLRLLQAEETSPRSTMLLELALRGADEQRALIQKVLAVFAEELGGILGQETGSGSDLRVVLGRAVETLTSAFAEKRVRLVVTTPELDGQVSFDESHLERVVAHLLEKALEQAPGGSEVQTQLVEEGDSILLEVRTTGAGAKAGLNARSAMRSQFCRMIVESCGGGLGQSPNETEGQRFWLRLPRVQP